jgi:hypothetical protein
MVLPANYLAAGSRHTQRLGHRPTYALVGDRLLGEEVGS